MKAWRRSGGLGSVTELPESFTLADLGGETVEAQDVAQWVGTHFALLEVSVDGLDPWVIQQESPISFNPQVLDVAGELGHFLRGAVTTGNGIPITQWSNIVQVTA